MIRGMIGSNSRVAFVPPKWLLCHSSGSCATQVELLKVLEVHLHSQGHYKAILHVKTEKDAL